MRVIIVGGGLGGLALANLLAKGRVDGDSGGAHEVVVLERDADPTAREQGLAIGLAQGGVDVLELIGIDLGKVLQPLASGLGVRDLAMMSSGASVLVRGSNWMTVRGANGAKYSMIVHRQLLRHALANALPALVQMRWNSHVLGFDEDDESVTVELADGSRIKGDVLVAADGWHSKTRLQSAPSLAPQPLPERVFSIAGTAVLPSSSSTAAIESRRQSNLTRNTLLHEASQSLVRLNATRGVSLLMFVYRGEPGATADTERILIWSLSLPLADPAAAGLGVSDPAEALANACALLRENMTRPDDAVELLSLTLPESVIPGSELESVPLPALDAAALTTGRRATTRVTLLGDAAHKTTTHTGMGATAALQDAEDLASRLLRVDGPLVDPAVLREYEVAMIERAKTVVSMATGMTARIHAVHSRGALSAIEWIMWTVGWVVSAVSTFKSLVAGK